MAGAKRAKRYPLAQARWRLATLWLVFVSLISALLIVQSIFNREYQGVQQEVWSWFIPNTVPTLSLIVSILGAAAMSAPDRRNVERNFYRVAFWMSFVYLAALASTILIQPFSEKKAGELFKLSNYWLAPMQGLAVASIGFLFTRDSGGEPRS